MTKTEPPIVPRPLERGEFYCHACAKFLPLAEHSKHRREHEQLQKEKNR